MSQIELVCEYVRRVALNSVAAGADPGDVALAIFGSTTGGDD